MKKYIRKGFKKSISSILAVAMTISLFQFNAEFDVSADSIVSDLLVKTTYNGHTYAVINQTLSWSDGKILCESLGGHLVSVNNEAEQNYLNELMQKTGTYKAYWTGGYKRVLTNTWTWLTDEDFGYTNWDLGEPNFENEDKVYMYGDNSIAALGTWNNHIDSSTGTSYGKNIQIAAICEWETSEEYAVEETFNGKKYQLFDKHMKWSEAKEYCEQIGGHLITVTSAEEETFFEDLIRKGQNVMYWMGGKYDFNKSKWEWITGENFTYSNWDYREPNNYIRYTDGERESCAMIYKQPNLGKGSSRAYSWNDSYDDGNLPGQEDFFFTDNFGFVCEFEDKPEIPQNVTLNRTDNGFAVSWDIAGGNTAGYIVYKKGIDGNFEPISEVLVENYFEDVLESVNGVYTYAVAAKDSFGVVGELSKESSISVNLSSMPAPADVVTDISGSRIEIKWIAPESDDVAYFRVYRKTSDSDYVLIKDNYKYLTRRRTLFN